jgi:hypothetical protein
VENYQQGIKLNISTFEDDQFKLMKSLAELREEAAVIQLQIRKLFLGKNAFEEGLTDKLTTVATITTLREKLLKIQKEIRVRFPDAE